MSWKQPYNENDKIAFKLLSGIDEIIKEEWPHLCMYFGMWGWKRIVRYGDEDNGSKLSLVERLTIRNK